MVLARFVLALLCLAAACAEEAPCKWSWKSLGCTPKDACQIKPRLALPWCAARNATCDETAKAAAAGDGAASAAADSADAPAEPAADEDPPPSEEAAEAESEAAEQAD